MIEQVYNFIVAAGVGSDVSIDSSRKQKCH